MQARFATAVLLGFVLVAGAACGGGGGDDTAKLTELEERVEAAEEARKKAEEEAAEAERKRQEAEADAKKAADAEAARKKAEDEAAAEKKRADDAEAERKRLADEAEEEKKKREAAEKRIAQTTQERQFAGFVTSAGTLSVTARNGAFAIIKTPTVSSPTFTAAVSPARWDMTSGTARDGSYSDSVTIYSDVGPATNIPFKDSKYNANKAVFDAAGDRKGDYRLSGSRTDVVATRFPTSSGVPTSFDVADRGRYTQAQIDALPDTHPDKNTAVARPVEHNKRWTIDAVEGSLGGAVGSFRCESSTKTSCTVQKRGDNHFYFSGPWAFRPTDSGATSTVSVADEHFMWFGWWARENIATKEWSYAVGHGPAGSRVSSVSAVSGSATYSGSAIGWFAIDRELGTDEAGAFTATARLEADFDANTLSGTLSSFTGDDVPSGNAWTVNLQRGSISGGSARGTSAWTIGSDADEGGSWAARFYSDLPPNQRTGVVPYGVAGTFTAEHSGIAKMTGAFGAHR